MKFLKIFLAELVELWFYILILAAILGLAVGLCLLLVYMLVWFNLWGIILDIALFITLWALYHAIIVYNHEQKVEKRLQRQKEKYIAQGREWTKEVEDKERRYIDDWC